LSKALKLDLPQKRGSSDNVPLRAMVIDADEMELSLMADRLRSQTFEVAVARNLTDAMRLLDAKWFPLILFDSQIPALRELQLVETLRARGGEDTYFVMLSAHAAGDDFERGAGTSIDDCLSKKWSDAELLARLRAGLHTVALRRSLRTSRAALAVAHSMSQTDAKTPLLIRLQSEVARARRYRRSCSVLLVGVHANGNDADAVKFDAELEGLLMQSLRGTIRLDIDAIALYEASDRHFLFAIVLPETGPAEVAIIRHRVRTTISQRLRELNSGAGRFDVSIGAASVDPNVDSSSYPPSDRPEGAAEQLMQSAQACGQCMLTRGAQRLAAVQSSVVNQVAIPCRHGYAVADHCLELAQAGRN
jgi:CheY-like chemotaxis protein